MTTKDTKTFSILAYITIIGWIISYVKRDTNDPVMMQHINQAFVLSICGLALSTITQLIGPGIITSLLSIVSLVLFVLWVMGFVRAIKMNGEPLPIIGGIQIFK